jgi:subtilisin family serine protease
LTGGEKLRAEGLTGKGIKVAVIDSGVDDTHPGFNGKVVQQQWFRWGTPLSDDDHGTHVAGTIHMMAPDAELYDYRVFGEEAGFDVDEAIAVAIVEAVYDGCHVINMSLGGRWPSLNIRTAVQYAESNGVIVVCAAGNEGDDDPLTNERGYPALWPEAISVAAVGKAEGFPVAKFSSSNPQVDYSGIGVDVTSFKPGGGLQQMSGTSMACPHVAGLIAALLSDERLIFEPGSKKDDFVREHLEKYHVVDIEKVGPDNATGIGFLTYLDKDEYEELISRFLTVSVTI